MVKHSLSKVIFDVCGVSDYSLLVIEKMGEINMGEGWHRILSQFVYKEPSLHLVKSSVNQQEFNLHQCGLRSLKAHLLNSNSNSNSNAWFKTPWYPW